MAIPAARRFSTKMPTDLDYFTFDFTSLIGTRTVVSGSAATYYNNAGVAGSPASSDLTQPVAANVVGNTVTAVLTGGTLNTDYIVEYTVTLSDGSYETRSAYLFVGQA